MQDVTPGAPAGDAMGTGEAGDPIEGGEAGETVEIVVQRADVVATRRGPRPPATRVRSALDTARRLARNPAVVASASAVGAVALREGVALARRAALREAARRPTAQVPVVVVVNTVWFVHEHRWPGPASPGGTVARTRTD